MDWGNCVQEGIATLQCIPAIFKNIVDWALIFGGVTALFFIIYAGIKYIRSGGEQEKVKSARETLTYAIIGLIIILLSFAIVKGVGIITGATCIERFGFGNCN